MASAVRRTPRALRAGRKTNNGRAVMQQTRAPNAAIPVIHTIRAMLAGRVSGKTLAKHNALNATRRLCSALSEIHRLTRSAMVNARRNVIRAACNAPNAISGSPRLHHRTTTADPVMTVAHRPTNAPLAIGRPMNRAGRTTRSTRAAAPTRAPSDTLKIAAYRVETRHSQAPTPRSADDRARVQVLSSATARRRTRRRIATTAVRSNANLLRGVPSTRASLLASVQRHQTAARRRFAMNAAQGPLSISGCAARRSAINTMTTMMKTTARCTPSIRAACVCPSA